MHSGFEDKSREQDRGWDDRFGDFLTNLLFEEGLADSTLLVLKNHLIAFNRWLLDTYGRPWDRVQPQDLREYLYATGLNLVSTTLQARRWSLKRLYKWALEESIVAVHPNTFVLPVNGNKAKNQTKPPTQRQIEMLLHMPNLSSAEGIRDRAVLELIYATGMRASEILSIKIHEITKEKCLRVWGKCRKERLVVYGEHAQYWIAQYIAVRKAILLDGGHHAFATEKLFVSSGVHADYRYYQLRRMIQRYSQRCGLKLTPHNIRHAFATHMYEAGASLQFIQNLLGHSHLQTSTIYISNNTKNLNNILVNHHPRGKSYKSIARFKQVSISKKSAT
ncbi:tyrosine-type recombinase/integrase [Comamonas kerstersii]|uniref:tyrosine-type recombinase/integrase n=1 Tax=Comamonas kerstersii TaxID=225992 RepID=UPI00266BD163|nr:tyrosine-type recombinase/integrase [Comamonas kerstersii]